MLDFVDTPKRMVVLEPVGKQFVSADPDERKAIWRDQLLKLQLFREVYEILQRQPAHELDQDFVLETIVMHMPHENYEKVFDTFIGWARFGEMLTYDRDSGKITLT